jgi:glyceraldehyde-3-phosphate dehydrogenase (NADP+)
MQTFELYIAGQFIKTTTELAVTEKNTGEVFAHTYLADQALMESAIEKAAACKSILADWPLYERFDTLTEIAAKISSSRMELATLLSRESGKPITYALAEIDRSAQTFSVAATACRSLSGEIIRMDWTAVGKGKEGFIQSFPIGIVAGISPFNFPMNLAVHKIAPAIAAGCPILLKPASATPLSTLALAKIISTTRLPHGALSLLPCTRETGMMLVTDERISLLSFTGSPKVGWHLKEKCGKKKAVLELGGNAGVIIGATAVLKDIISKCILGAFAYSGQICIHAQRFFVHRTHYLAFIELMREATLKITKGAPLLPETQFSVMIDEENAVRVDNWVNEAIEEGAKVVLRGGRSNNYLDPIILTSTKANMKVRKEEVFGPAICIEPFDEIEEAIKLVNEGSFGLQCGIFTNLIEELDLAFKHLEVGGVIHNDVPTLRLDHMPYGGIKDSGLGREGVKYAMMDMMETRILVK